MEECAHNNAKVVRPTRKTKSVAPETRIHIRKSLSQNIRHDKYNGPPLFNVVDKLVLYLLIPDRVDE